MKKQFVSIHLDFIGFVASILCAIHCAALPFLLSFIPLVGLEYLDNPYVEYTMIIISFLIASLALIRSYNRHHGKFLALHIVITGFILIVVSRFSYASWQEVLLTSLGGVVIAIAHFVNWKLINQYTSRAYQKNKQSKEIN